MAGSLMAQYQAARMKRKALWIVFTLLLAIPLLALIPTVVHAAGFLPDEVITGYLYDRYPITNYSLDSYVDTSGNWLPWNWGKALDAGIFSFLSFLLGLAFSGCCIIYHLIGILVQELFSLDIISGLADKVGSLIQNLAGFGEGSNGIFISALVLVAAIMGAWLVWTALVKRDSGSALSGLGGFILILMVSIGFFLNSGTIIKGANELSASAQSIVSVPITAVGGMDSDPTVGIREQYFNTTVYQPYLLFQYGTTEVPEEEAARLLKEVPGSEAREEHVQELAEAGNKMMSGWTGFNERALYFIPLFCVNMVCSFVVLFFSAIGMYHQVSFLLFVALSPIVLILSLLPNSIVVAQRWFKKTVYELIMKVLVTALLTLMFALSNMVLSVMGSRGYLLGVIVQAIIYIGVFLKRNKIFSILMLADAQNSKSNSLRHHMMNALLLKKGWDSLKGGFGGSAPKVEYREGEGASAETGDAAPAPEAGYGMGSGLPGSNQAGLPEMIKRGGSGSEPIKPESHPPGDIRGDRDSNEDITTSIAPGEVSEEVTYGYSPESQDVGEGTVKTDFVNREKMNEDFDRFWEAYPRKVGKSSARKQWEEQMESGVDPEDLIASAENYAKECSAHGAEERYVKHGSNFLAENRFEDYTPENYQPTQTANQPIKRDSRPPNSFHNFDQRDTDYEALLREERLRRAERENSREGASEGEDAYNE